MRSDIEITTIVDLLPFGATEIEMVESETSDVEHIYIYLSNSTLDLEKVN